MVSRDVFHKHPDQLEEEEWGYVREYMALAHIEQEERRRDRGE